jgi:hypothetical protein
MNGGIHEEFSQQRKKNKSQGVLAGIPDINIMHACKFYALELKADDGALSEAQAETIGRLAAAGAVVGVTYGQDEAIRWLGRHGLLRGRMV